MLYFFKPLDRLLAHFLDPRVRAFGQLGMLLAFPTSGSFTECIALFAAPGFPLHKINDESGALLGAGKPVDCSR